MMAVSAIPQMRTIEMLLGAVARYAAEPPSTRLSRLAAITCETFNSDGCVMMHPGSQMTAQHRVQYSYSQTGHCPQGRIQRLMTRIAASKKPVLLLNSAKHGGPAIIAWGVQNQMLLYRDDLSLGYTEEDAALVGALWRACGIGQVIPASQAGDRPSIAELDFPPRIRQVLAFMLDGLLEKQIASELRISPHTVHVHVKSLYRRMGVNSKSELMIRCYTRGVDSSLLHQSVQNQVRLLSA